MITQVNQFCKHGIDTFKDWCTVCRLGIFAGIPDPVPVIPPLSPGLPNTDPNPVVAKCGECGLELYATMCYSCSNPRCPVFPQTTC